MKKSLMFTIFILAVIAIIISFYAYNKYQETKQIQSMNKQEFSFLKCISECPIIHSTSTNKSSIKPACISNCTTSNPINSTLQKKYLNEQLIKDFSYISCVNNIDVRDATTYEKYQNCLVDIFPKLQEKYSYLKG